jgi:hypothetical protein
VIGRMAKIQRGITRGGDEPLARSKLAAELVFASARVLLRHEPDQAEVPLSSEPFGD